MSEIRKAQLFLGGSTNDIHTITADVLTINFTVLLSILGVKKAQLLSPFNKRKPPWIAVEGLLY